MPRHSSGIGDPLVDDKCMYCTEEKNIPTDALVKNKIIEKGGNIPVAARLTAMQ